METISQAPDRQFMQEAAEHLSGNETFQDTLIRLAKESILRGDHPREIERATKRRQYQMDRYTSEVLGK